MSHHQREYYAMIDDERRGPYTVDQLLAAGVRLDTYVWYEGSRRWLPAHEVPELVDLLSEAPTQTNTYEDEDGIEVHPESYLQTPYSPGMYLWFIAIGWTVFFAYQGGAMRESVAVIGIAGGAILWALAIACLLTFWYRVLVLVQDGYAWLSPGAAVGYLFIPIYNCYWIFCATVGTVRELNRYADRRGLIAPRPSLFLPLAVAIYFAFAMVPIVGLAGTLLNLVMFPLFLSSIKTTALCFCAGRRQRTAGTPTVQPNKSDKGAIAAAVLATVIMPISLLMCSVGCLLPWKDRWLPANEPGYVVAAVGIALCGGVLGLFELFLFDASRSAGDRTASNDHMIDSQPRDRFVVEDD